MRIATIKSVASAQLCTGCGACASLAPDRYRMADVTDHGRRPIAIGEVHADDTERALLDICPGVGLEHDRTTWSPRIDPSLAKGWGPIVEVWQGFATDPRVRYEGSSGGVATALALHAVASGTTNGVLHIRSRPDAPWLNETVLSQSAEDVHAATGSRYSPASPVESLHLLRDSDKPTVFIGKPCDAAAVHAIAKRDPEIRAKIAVTVAIFCAGTPTWRGTLEMLAAMGFDDPASVEYLRYRGHGWPGHAAARGNIDGKETEVKLTYNESWNKILQRHRQWRCYICPDHTGEFADIAVGDPWYEPPTEGAAGESLVIVRTERGARWIAEMREQGLLTLVPVPGRVLEASQPFLMLVRGSVWGRLIALRLAGAGVPRYIGLPTFRFWLSRLSLRAKVQSIFGTFRRVVHKRLRKNLEMVPRNDGR